jgi:stage II sporulation protein AA (anti-sigma F factor antagonist)
MAEYRASNRVRFQVDVERVHDMAIVKLAGEFDAFTEERIDSVLDALGGDVNHVVMDLREASFIDSHGVRVLIKYELRSREEGFRFAVVPGNGHIRRVFDTLAMDKLLTLLADLESLDGEGPARTGGSAAPSGSHAS